MLATIIDIGEMTCSHHHHNDGLDKEATKDLIHVKSKNVNGKKNSLQAEQKDLHSNDPHISYHRNDPIDLYESGKKQKNMIEMCPQARESSPWQTQPNFNLDNGSQNSLIVDNHVVESPEKMSSEKKIFVR